jgi:hypothetical protein
MKGTEVKLKVFVEKVNGEKEIQWQIGLFLLSF